MVGCWNAIKFSWQKNSCIYVNVNFSLVVKLTTIRALLALVVAHDLELEQLDVKTAFLHGDIDEEIYMDQPKGYKKGGKENLVCSCTD